MNGGRIVTASELPLLFEMTAARIGQFSVGFVKIVGDEDDVGPPRLHRPLLRIDATRKVTVAAASYDSEGPDLGLLVLADHDAATLRA